MTYVFIGESRSRSRLFLLSKIFLTWTYHKQKWQIQILGLKLSQNRSQDRFGTWYVHVKEIFDKRKKPGKNWLSIADQPVFDRKFDNKHTCTVRSWGNPIILKCISCGTGLHMFLYFISNGTMGTVKPNGEAYVKLPLCSEYIVNPMRILYLHK